MRCSAPSFAPLVLLTLALASCVAAPVETPQPAPRPAPAPAAPPPAAPVPSDDWTDRPVSIGDWRYAVQAGDTIARFGPVAGAPLLTVQCELATRRIIFTRQGVTSGSALTIRTSFGAVQWPAQPNAAGLAAVRSASDGTLDQIAFSRGRFAVEAAGAAPLILPAWAEVARVIEDCRG